MPELENEQGPKLFVVAGDAFFVFGDKRLDVGRFENTLVPQSGWVEQRMH